MRPPSSGIVVVSGALLWLALPVRPRLRLPVQVDPLLTPLALVAAAVATPYVLDQIALQNAATGLHAQNPHYFDMAWMVTTLVVVGILGAVLPGGPSPRRWWPERVWCGPARWACCSPPTDPGRVALLALGVPMTVRRRPPRPRLT